ncbi:MAG: 16S rRNA methyltransferase [Chloroflexota bacterium]|nr:MAG: 16S rRNA methyltransferase [Bellilinea sp.]
MPEPLDIDALIRAVQANPRYAAIDPGLIRGLIERYQSSIHQPRELIKAVRNKLHQVGGAYLEKPIDYANWGERLAILPHDLHHPRVKEFCRQMMALHASTRERLPILDRFYAETLTSLQPIHSILDLACGLNPLALPWMPVNPTSQIHVCDIYSDQINFLQQFFNHFGIHGQATLCDLSRSLPQQSVQVAFLLKSIPCLEQLDKTIATRLLHGIPADYWLVSFPAHSLGGRGKGMRQYYRQHFEELTHGWEMNVQSFEFPGELVFLLSRA